MPTLNAASRSERISRSTKKRTQIETRIYVANDISLPTIQQQTKARSLDTIPVARFYGIPSSTPSGQTPSPTPAAHVTIHDSLEKLGKGHTSLNPSIDSRRRQHEKSTKGKGKQRQQDAEGAIQVFSISILSTAEDADREDLDGTDMRRNTRR